MKTNDDTALGVMYDRYAGIAFALAYRTIGDRGQAEEVVQEAFLSLWRRAHTFDARRGNLKSWLMTIVRNSALERRRGRIRHESTEHDVDDHAWRLDPEDAWSDVERNLTRDAVQEALHALPDAQLDVIRLAYFNGLTETEIADQTSLPLGTIKGHARLGLRKLHEGLQPAYEPVGYEQDTDG